MKWVAGIVWVVAWIPLSTLVFQSHPHIDALLQPLMLIADLLPDAERSVEATAYLWSDAHLRLTVFPALTFWIGLILVIVITPNRNSKKDQ